MNTLAYTLLGLAAIYAPPSAAQLRNSESPPEQVDILAAADSGNPHIDLFAGIVADARWPTSRIYVCWEQDGGDLQAKEWTREAVAETWERHSGLQFVGWQTCAVRNAGIHIAVRDEGPHVKVLGRKLDKVEGGMVLNFTFNNWSSPCITTRKECIMIVAVHEFGHAIGLTHEQNRPDTPGECAKRAQGPNPDTLLTPYDPSSSLNYCNRKWLNAGVLSEFDKDAAVKLYGPPASRVGGR